MATTKPKTTKKKKGQDIPLDNIPERGRTSYPLELKEEAARRVIAGEPAEKVAREMNISNGSMVHKWAQAVRTGQPLKPGKGGARHQPAAKHDVMKEVRTALERARQARDERLEMAAFIVESDCPDAKEGTALAKRIRAMKRPQ